ncbi:fibrinogen-related domain-containing protein, partial [Escherichia coli]|nr:fibrinogen-related domain-containing protein [Escherichia coli]
DDGNRVHTIYPSNSHPIRVYCDQTTDTGGWTVIQRRLDGSEDFYRNWADYESGFGTPESEYWIGLQNLQALTTGRAVTLRVDMMNVDGTPGFATYNSFSIGNQQDNYKLHISGFQGTAGDMLSNDTLMQFSTYDRDHDLSDISCAQAYHGAWWYRACSSSNLNGEFGSSFRWGTWSTLQRAEMKIRI